jgi:hypothetical protein
MEGSIVHELMSPTTVSVLTTLLKLEQGTSNK